MSSEITWPTGCSIESCRRFTAEEVGKGDTCVLAAKMRRDLVGNCGNCDIVHAGKKIARLRAEREKREAGEWAKQMANRGAMSTGE